ncbi:hypothetical protein J7T55_007811 [Diaporthe amygdali]|uniref:uncharacterized protein n=1 Tax=Phomopsis amygdali TaxID=1214568 RepID=UPI0022FEF6B6|nr:uncharacterized protein J7T55_007811 [Diaporthe amygdali]KAJ0107620.1 hypothetical protein J7T55_007811 [Diaporthe amygdali]
MTPSTPEPKDAAAAGNVTATRSQRVLACVCCSQRKIKCDRVFPCANCVRAGMECVRAAQQAHRRRRFPERELLGRIRYYESLLRQNGFSFHPLHMADYERGREREREQYQHVPLSDETHFSDARSDASSHKAIDFFHAIGSLSLDSEDEHDDDDGDGSNLMSVKNPWPEGYDHLLFFGTPLTDPNLHTLHPEQVHILRLWQIYLDNVDPLLKVTHTPTVQSRIVDAIGDTGSISPTFHALMFSIYCVSVMSLSEDECFLILQTHNLDSLTALYLYLVSVQAKTDPLSLSSTLAVAIRIAKRMKIHDESSFSGCDALEAETRRRLWWALTLFDHRTCEMSDFRDTSLAPTWDCKPPSSISDSDLRPGIKAPPAIHDKPTEALFAVVRSELADFLRHSAFHINFINPSLNSIVQPKAARQWPAAAEGDTFVTIEKTLEEKRLALCNPETSLHFMTIWTMRSALARIRLLQYYSRQSASVATPTGAQRSAAISCALRMLDCDTKLRAHTLTRGFLWFVDMYLPAIAFNHVLNGLRNRPDEDWAGEAWDAMSANYEARTSVPSPDKHRNLVIWIPIVLHVWHLREALLERQNMPPAQVPRIVTLMREKARQMSSGGEFGIDGTPGDINNIDGFEMEMPMNWGSFAGAALVGCPELSDQPLMNADAGQFWTQTDWT